MFRLPANVSVNNQYKYGFPMSKVRLPCTTLWFICLFFFFLLQKKSKFSWTKEQEILNIPCSFDIPIFLQEIYRAHWYGGFQAFKRPTWFASQLPVYIMHARVKVWRDKKSCTAVVGLKILGRQKPFVLIDFEALFTMEQQSMPLPSASLFLSPRTSFG